MPAITIEHLKKQKQEIESNVKELAIKVSETLICSENLLSPVGNKKLETQRLETLDRKIQSLLSEVTTGEHGQILKTDTALKQEIKDLRNHHEYLSRKIQLFYPDTSDNFKKAIWWFLDSGISDGLSLIQDVKGKPPYNDQEIQNLFKKAETRLAQTSQESPETMIAIAEIKDHAPEQPLQMGQSYCLQTGIKNEGLDEEDPDLAELDVVVWAEGMEILPKWTQTYLLNKNQELSLIQFQLKPTSLGKKKIRVEFYYELHWLGEVKFETQVVEAKQLVNI
ncbi:MAG: hypothetical protein GPI96_06440 [Microcystis aeruginosa BS13-02]|jgi:hypothetical protein|uniref:hypothetical protein n=1 Tax=Microcystis sp. BLCC-F210 TaxID=3342751 RepID=UPI0035C8C17D|nr:hypothetical protein [Microcystis aeruginosa BS13-02]